MTEVKATVLLPAFNEEENIAPIVEKIRALHPDFEILVVDDGSSDSTAEAARQAGARVFSHPYNVGNGAAVKAGLRRASGRWVIMMDADGQHDPADISKLLAYGEEYDMVIGARTRGSDTSRHRDTANWVYNALASWVTKFKVEDLTSGFRLVERKTVRKYLPLLPNTFSYPSTITMAYLKSGKSIRYVPVTAGARKGTSKIKPLQDGTLFFLIIMKIATIYSPMRVFLPVSLLFFLTGVSYYGYTFITSRRFSNMSALLFTTSIIIFMIGLVSEQIAQMRYDREDRE